MALTNNPNLSRGIEKRWRKEINKRFSLFLKRVLPYSNRSPFTFNVSDQEQQEIDQYMAEFTAFIITILLSNDWQNKYQTEIYTQTVDRAEAQYRATTAVSEDRATAALLQSLFDSPAQANELHRNELGFLHNRANDKLKAVTDFLDSDVRQIINDNISTATVDDITKLIRERVGKSVSSARLIAQTEITQAAQRAVINVADSITATSGVQQAVIWITVNDSKVRHLHAGWHGQQMTTEEARKNANISPWNCRCGFRIVALDSLTGAQILQFKRERISMLNRKSA